jgi:hypothetical protein
MCTLGVWQDLTSESEQAMALHRDIFWIGRQWTVTGFGIQACDQKNYAAFDIEASRLWDPRALDKTRDQSWLNIVDFEKALGIARQRYPEPPSALPPQPPPSSETSVLGLIDTLLKDPVRNEAWRNEAWHNEVWHTEPGATAVAIEPRKPSTAAKFAMRVSRWPAKFVPSWRIRISR